MPLSNNIQITHIETPDEGWPIATYCPICKTTTIALNRYADKPDNGDFFWVNNVCELFSHSMRLIHGGKFD